MLVFGVGVTLLLVSDRLAQQLNMTNFACWMLIIAGFFGRLAFSVASDDSSGITLVHGELSLDRNRYDPYIFRHFVPTTFVATT